MGLYFNILLAAGLLSSSLCWSATLEDRDPWEGYNRAVFKFNDTLDFYVLRPVATGYVRVMPDPLERGVSNFFNNVGEIKTITNSLFQLKFKQAGLDSTRFLVNTTVGLFGFIDIGSRIGLEKHDEDFGQTLGYWGVPSGPYFVLPLLGPNTVRDTGGMFPDYYLSPYRAIDYDLTSYSVRAMEVLDLRASLLEVEKLVAGDRYTFFRNAYLQRRDFLVTDGKISDDFLDDDLMLDDFDADPDEDFDSDGIDGQDGPGSDSEPSQPDLDENF